MLKVYNTLTKQKEEFKPLKEGQVSIYVAVLHHTITLILVMLAHSLLGT